MMTKISPNREPDWSKGSEETVIGKGAEFEGTLKATGDIRIDGKFKGTIHVEGNLRVGKDGELNAEVHAKGAEVSGEVKGNLYIDGKIEFMDGAKFEGELECKGFVVHDGVIFDGNCRMSKKKGKSEKDSVLPIKEEKGS